MRTRAVSRRRTCRHSRRARPRRSHEPESRIVTRPAARLERARSRLAAGDVAGARRECAPLAEAEPRVAAAAHVVLSACAQREGDAQAARRHVETALALDAD